MGVSLAEQTRLYPAQDRADRVPRPSPCIDASGTSCVRNYWHIENRLHYVRDFTYDEDRCRAYVRHLPHNLACLTNAAIAIVRCKGRFRYLPEANRHYAARAQDALDTIMNVSTA